MPLSVEAPRATLDAAAYEAFARDGVVAVAGVVDADGVAALRAVVAAAMASPGRHAQEFLSGGGGRYFSDLHSHRRHPALADIALTGGPAKVAAALLAPDVRLFYDQMIVKEAGTPSPTPWHHDLPFWPVTGEQIMSIWIALDAVTPDNGGVEYARGSHRWPQRWRPTQPDTPATRAMRNMDLPPAPNLSRDPDADRVSFALAPGDAILFTATTLHGAGPNRAREGSRRALVLRYAGAGTRFVGGPHALTFDAEPGLADGDMLDGPLFPRLRLA
ncbi:phytanoyl-CoA dioxygenase family protein [Sandaracinobacteroides saxicola]|uniref:Phytanoyl-CoA dioxygenase family protein n=1 Tax=Sandaracinobacteroides saxicola TaxID=2759707 RepID=A0A7G5ILF4_9SPHN|nr:phytanoyl-CoA dioxygenase family protein [Sandaracinobacteroides saxicola]QMW24196.1 phytanoyl-CoA dioxygenase family protein [Sandaracinobacteroides saxicola]